MEAIYPNTDQPDFSSLTGIMLRFYTVPYDQFQKELDGWFVEGLTSAGLDDREKFEVLAILDDWFLKVKESKNDPD